MKKLTLLLLLVTSVFACSNTKDPFTVNIKDFGAVGDSLTMNTKAIQSAIDACAEKGGGVVWIPEGKFVTGTIELKSNITLSLSYGAYILGSQDYADYRYDDIFHTREGNPRCLIYAYKAENIKIEGMGRIDGRGTPEAFPKHKPDTRPMLMNLMNCKGITFSGVSFRRPAFWGLHLTDCEDIYMNGIDIFFRYNGTNNDGMDLDGCKNVFIENSSINSGDDAICLKSSLNACDGIVVRNCRVSSGTAAVKFGTSSRGGFKNVDIQNCYFYDCPMGAIKLQAVDGGHIDNIKISNIVMEEVGNPIFIRLGSRNKNFGKGVTPATHDQTGSIKNVYISNLRAEVVAQTREKALIKKETREVLSKRNDAYWDRAGKTKAGAIMITGIPDYYVENVTLENIEITFPGGVKQGEADVIKEDEKRYPEQFFFGILPAWGAYIRHAKDITFKNVNLKTRLEDEREMIVLDDVFNMVQE